MAEKRSVSKLLEEKFKECKNSKVTYEDLADIIQKAPTTTNAKKIYELKTKYKCNLLTKAEEVKQKNIADAKQKELEGILALFFQHPDR